MEVLIIKVPFDKHLQKILAVLNLSVDDLVFFEAKPKTVDVVYSENAPNDYQMNKRHKSNMVCLWMFLIFAKFIIERYIVMSEKIVQES